jgi:two-component system LytT family response regulator
MYATLLLENQRNELLSLRSKIEKYCPCLEIIGQADSLPGAQALLQGKKPDLVFMNPDFISFETLRNSVGVAVSDAEIIYVSHSGVHTLEAIGCHAIGYLIKPIQEEALIATVEEARIRVKEKEERRKDKLLLERLMNGRAEDELIGIPTLEGFDFLLVKEIIRCEGLQKCTRVVTVTKTDIISSYNIGEFKKILEPYHFFSPHKSHLVNLAFIKKYKREGTIMLRDNSSVPISKRKKSEFLEQIIHL